MVSTIGFAQNEISGFYSLSGFDGNVDCNIFLYKNGSYFLELSENVTDDIVESLALSYGKFSLTNNEVTLIDKIHNYKMRLVLENKTLKITVHYEKDNKSVFIKHIFSIFAIYNNVL